MVCLLFCSENIRLARPRLASAQQKTRRGLPPGRSGVVSVNTLFWKILVTRVKHKMCDASVVSLSCCPNSGFARVRHFERPNPTAAGRGYDRRERRQRSRLPTTARRLCANPRRCGASATVFHVHALHTAPPFHRGGEMMRKFLFATAALSALAGPAIAADMRLPVYKAPSIVPVWSWSGCYVGGHAGALWAKSKDWIVRTPGGAFYGQSLGEHALDSWLGGAQAGCDYQFAGGFVIGIQGDYAWTNAEGSHDSAREIGVAYHSKVKSLASVTGRIGYAWDRLLGYVRAVRRGSATNIGQRRSSSELLTR